MATVRLQLTAGYQRALVRTPAMVAACRKAGEHIQEQAERLAPRDPGLPKDRRRHYADMFDTQAGLDQGAARATVNNRHFIALFVEFGTGHSPAYATLRRALDSSAGKAL
jgi:hypothetical protein